jgi:hypothetical protein
MLCPESSGLLPSSSRDGWLRANGLADGSLASANGEVVVGADAARQRRSVTLIASHLMGLIACASLLPAADAEDLLIAAQRRQRGAQPTMALLREESLQPSFGSKRGS